MLVVSLVGLLYAVSASHYVQGGDNGEFATIFAEGGVAHPTGYPLYSLWLRAFCWLPAATPAHGAALATALLAAVANGVFYSGMRAWGARPIVALLGLLLFALARQPWLLATSAEVFAMNHLLAATVLVCSGPEAPVSGSRRAAALAVLGGLLASVHLTGVLLLPCFVYGLWQASRESSIASTMSRLPWGLLGLTPFAYLSWVAHHPGERWVWGEPQSFIALCSHVLRREYGTLTLSPSGSAQVASLDQVTSLMTSLMRELWGTPVLVLALVAYLTWRKDRRFLSTWPLLGSFLLSGPLFVAQFNIPLVGVGSAIVARFYALPAMLLACLFAVLLSHAIAELRHRTFTLAFGLLVAVTTAVAIVTNFAMVLRLNGPYIEQYLTQTLESLPRGAVLLGTNDLREFGFLYLQRARGVRPDVVYASPAMLMRDWYRNRVAKKIGVAVRAPVENAYDGPGFVDDLQRSGRCVVLLDTSPLMQPLLDTHPNYPLGTLVYLLRAGEPEPSLSTLLAMNRAWFDAHPAPVAPLPAEARWEQATRSDYYRSLRYLGDELEKQGRHAEAAPFLDLAARVVRTEP